MDKNTQKAISKVINWLRDTHNLSVEEMANMLSKSENYIYMIERGDRTPSLSLIVDIVNEFDTKLGKFFIWVDIFRNMKEVEEMEDIDNLPEEEIFGGEI